MEAYRSLILRANRSLGAYLAENALIQDDDFAKANERLMEVLQEGHLRQANLLNILCFELKVLNEDALVTHLVEEHNLGLVDLDHVKVKPLAKDLGFDLDLCRATGTLPFDFQDGVVCIASTFYLSKPVVKHWEELLKKYIFWYGTGVVSLAHAFEKLEEAEAAAKAEAAKAPGAPKSA